MQLTWWTSILTTTSLQVSWEFPNSQHPSIIYFTIRRAQLKIEKLNEIYGSAFNFSWNGRLFSIVDSGPVFGNCITHWIQTSNKTSESNQSKDVRSSAIRFLAYTYWCCRWGPWNWCWIPSGIIFSQLADCIFSIFVAVRACSVRAFVTVICLLRDDFTLR